MILGCGLMMISYKGDWSRSGGAFGLHDDIVEHLMNFSMILEVVREEFACQFQPLGLVIVAAPHKHLKACQLQFSQFELVHMSE